MNYEKVFYPLCCVAVSDFRRPGGCGFRPWDPSYLDRYTAGRLISFPSSDLYAGDPVSGIESTWGHQTWIIDGQEIDVDVDKWDVPAEEAMEYFSKNSR